MHLCFIANTLLCIQDSGISKSHLLSINDDEIAMIGKNLAKRSHEHI